MTDLVNGKTSRDILKAGKVLDVTVASGSVGVYIADIELRDTISASNSYGPYTKDVRFVLNPFSGVSSYLNTRDKTTPNEYGVIAVAASRTLTQADNGCTLDCAASVVLTIPPGLSNFGCAVRPSGVQLACGAGVTINGASSTVTTTARVGAINPTGTANSYDAAGV